MTKRVDIHQAQTEFEDLIEIVIAGDDVVITRCGTPIARLVQEPLPSRTFGADAGVFTVPEDFDAPLPTDSELRP